MAMGWLLFTLLGLGIVGAPFFVLYLLVQHRKLRGQVNQLSDENSRQHATFTREVAELKKQLAGVGPIAGCFGFGGETQSAEAHEEGVVNRRGAGNELAAQTGDRDSCGRRGAVWDL